MKITLGNAIVLGITILFRGIFVVSIGVGAVQVLQEQAFLSKAEVVTGTIIGSQVDSSGNAVVFCPIIDFTT
jgi:hypothetical protein